MLFKTNGVFGHGRTSTAGGKLMIGRALIVERNGEMFGL